jgi:hypothetical protein
MVRARLRLLALAGSLLASSGCFHLTERGYLRHPTTARVGHTRTSAVVAAPALHRGSPVCVQQPAPVYVQQGSSACCCEDGTPMTLGAGPGFVSPPPPDTSVFGTEPPALSQGPQGPQIITVPQQGGVPWTPPQPRIVPVPQNAAPMPYTP